MDSELFCMQVTVLKEKLEVAERITRDILRVQGGVKVDMANIAVRDWQNTVIFVFLLFDEVFDWHQKNLRRLL